MAAVLDGTEGFAEAQLSESIDGEVAGPDAHVCWLAPALGVLGRVLGLCDGVDPSFYGLNHKRFEIPQSLFGKSIGKESTPFGMKSPVMYRMSVHWPVERLCCICETSTLDQVRFPVDVYIVHSLDRPERQMMGSKANDVSIFLMGMVELDMQSARIEEQCLRPLGCSP